MPILTSDLSINYSILNSPGYTNSQSAPNESLGAFVASNSWNGSTINDLFQILTPTNNSDLVSEYRCLFVVNKHSTLTLVNVTAWFSLLPTNSSIAIGVDPTDTSIKTSSTAQALNISLPTTNPSSVTFLEPNSYSNGLSLGDIPAGYVKGFWLKRTGTNSSTKQLETITLNIAGSSNK